MSKPEMITAEIKETLKGKEKIFSRDLIELLNLVRTVPLTQKALANILNHEGIYSKKIRIDGKQGKGYRLEQFTTVPAANDDTTVPVNCHIEVTNQRATVPLEKVTQKISATVPLNNGKRYAYSYEFTNGDAGTWLATVPPKDAKAALMARFLGRKIKILKLIN